MNESELPPTASGSKEKACFFPKIFTTHPKNGKRRKNRKSLSEERTAGSMLSSIERELGLTGLFEGEHNHLSFDCPKPLVTLFKEATRECGTSVCKELQKYALSYVVNYKLEKHAFGSTLSRVLKPKLIIENLNFEQYVQSRPRRLLRKSKDPVSEETVKCGFRGCGKVAIGKGVWLQSEKEYALCKAHLPEAKKNPKQWKVISESCPMALEEAAAP